MPAASVAPLFFLKPKAPMDPGFLPFHAFLQSNPRPYSVNLRQDRQWSLLHGEHAFPFWNKRNEATGQDSRPPASLFNDSEQFSELVEQYIR